MKGGLKALFNIIFELADIRTKYEEIKMNEESKKVSVVLGWRALRYNFLFALFVAFAVGLGMWGAQYVQTIAFLFGIVLIVLAIGCTIYALAFLLFALSASIKQIKLNRRFIGIFALILTLLFIAAVVASVAVVANKIK